MSEAIVVGSGPNGLACAATLASHGVAVTVIEAEETIGGGTRSSELTVPGVLHDECSGFHPTAVGSPALVGLGVERHGLEWAWPEVELAHPLDGGDGAAMLRSIEQTMTGLGPGGPGWGRLFGAPAKKFDALAEDILRPFAHLPKHPVLLTRFGLPALMPATVLAKTLATPQARALFGGVAAHSFSPLSKPMSSAVGMALICAGHRHGWPVARGGSRAIAEALAAVVLEHGGKIETGRPVRSLEELPAADAVALDLAPAGVAEIAAGRLPHRVARAYRRYRHGPGAFKVDLAVEGGVPWEQEAARRAGSVHAAGSFEEIVAGEREVNRGRMPARPFVLVGQQYLADPSRSAGDVHPVWAYAHVPSGYDGDATEALIDQIERFAPGLRERVVGRSACTPTQFEAGNANYVGGDILTGANTAVQTLFRPRLGLDPYATGIPGVFICSAATPPGPGAHGMCGYNAAQAILRGL
jgi:phytoene dehydrogenase-like protein